MQKMNRRDRLEAVASHTEQASLHIDAARKHSIEMAVARHVGRLGAHHAEGFAKSFNEVMACNPDVHDPLSIEAAATLYLGEYEKGAAQERERILAIDKIAADLPKGFEQMVYDAQFVNPISAGELAQKVVAFQRGRIPAYRAIKR